LFRSWSATGSCTVRVRSTDAAPSTPLLRVVLGQLTELIGHARPASEGGGQVADGGAAEPGADSVHRPVQGPARGAGRRAGAPGVDRKQRELELDGLLARELGDGDGEQGDLDRAGDRKSGV